MSLKGITPRLCQHCMLRKHTLLHGAFLKSRISQRHAEPKPRPTKVTECARHSPFRRSMAQRTTLWDPGRVLRHCTRLATPWAPQASQKQVKLTLFWPASSATRERAFSLGRTASAIAFSSLGPFDCDLLKWLNFLRFLAMVSGTGIQPRSSKMATDHAVMQRS